MKGDHCLKFWSKTQHNIVLSTAEAELVALVKGVCEAKGVASIMKDMTGSCRSKSSQSWLRKNRASHPAGAAKRGRGSHPVCRSGFVSCGGGQARPAKVGLKQIIEDEYGFATSLCSSCQTLLAKRRCCHGK